MPCPWTEYIPDPFPFCEEQICHIIGQPANTWSNIGYFIAAYFLIRSTHLARCRFSFAAITILLGLGSTIFHMSGTLWAKKLDVGSMLLLSSLVLIMGVEEYFRLSKKVTVALYFLLVAISVPWIGYGKAGGNIFLVGLATAVFLQVLLAKRRLITLAAKKLLTRTLLVFAIALMINKADQTGLLCWPDNHIFTGHGLWHLMTAYCIYLGAKFFCLLQKSEPSN